MIKQMWMLRSVTALCEGHRGCAQKTGSFRMKTALGDQTLLDIIEGCAEGVCGLVDVLGGVCDAGKIDHCPFIC